MDAIRNRAGRQVITGTTSEAGAKSLPTWERFIVIIKAPYNLMESVITTFQPFHFHLIASLLSIPLVYGLPESRAVDHGFNELYAVRTDWHSCHFQKTRQPELNFGLIFFRHENLLSWWWNECSWHPWEDTISHISFQRSLFLPHPLGGWLCRHDRLRRWCPSLPLRCHRRFRRLSVLYESFHSTRRAWVITNPNLHSMRQWWRKNKCRQSKPFLQISVWNCKLDLKNYIELERDPVRDPSI